MLRFTLGLQAIAVLTLSSVWGQSKNSTTVNGVTFDWAAPAAPLTVAQQAFVQSYKTAVNTHDEKALMALEDPARSSCKYDGHQILLRDLKNSIPENARVRLFPATHDFAKDFGLGDVAYLPVAPTATLGISFTSETKEHVSSKEIFRPVRQSGDTITLVPYCLTEKGQHLLEAKTPSK